MKRCVKIVVGIAGGIALGASLRAGDVALNDNPYNAIVTRNIFGLNPPQAVDTTPPPVEPPIKITPNGIMTIMGQSQVLYKTSVTGKPDQSYMLSEGQAEDEIEVVKIDEKDGLITFNNHGIQEQLALSTSSSAAASAPGQAVPGFNPVSGISMPAIGGQNGFNPAINGGVNNPGGRGLGGGQGGMNNPNNSGLNPQFGVAHNYTAPQPQAEMDPDVQKVLIVANHLKAIQDNDPVANIFPVTDIDKDAGVPSNTANPPDNSPPQ
jgi:hypothetical protein